jgi:hypothetical protein
MANPTKLRAKIESAEAKAERDLAALRTRAEKKIVKIREELRAREAKVEAKRDSQRERAEAKLARTERSVARGMSSDGSGLRRSSGKRSTQVSGRKPARRAARNNRA